jgi:hypothetical protein
MAHEHNDDGYDAADDGPVEEVSAEVAARLEREQLEQLAAAGFKPGDRF